MARGGKRKGAGRKSGSETLPVGWKARTIRVTDPEYTLVKSYIKKLREVPDEKD